jgi:hypothetical protein
LDHAKQPSPPPDSEEGLYDTFSPDHKIGSVSSAPEENIYEDDNIYEDEENIYDNPDASKLDVQQVSKKPVNTLDVQESIVRSSLRKSLVPEEDFDTANISDPEDPPSSVDAQKRDIENEPWYFGGLSSQKAADLMNNAGDFLVRESSRTKGQFVLTVRNADRVKHLNLLDEDGKVVNETRSFESVKEFIDYHIKTKDYIVIGAEKYFLGQAAEERYEFSH